MKRWSLWIVICSAIAGLALALMSTVQHLRIQHEGLAEQSFCAISETINCDIVNASSYAKFLGVPQGWWGACYYLLIAGMAIWSLRRGERRGTVMATWVLAAGGLLYSAYLAYIAAVVLGVVCIECLGMYAANLLIFICLWITMGAPLARLPLLIRDYARAVFGRPSNLGFAVKIPQHVIAAGIVFGLGWAAFAVYDAGKVGPQGKITLDEKLNAFKQQSIHDIKIDPTWPVWGNPDAKVTVVEYSDFQCPFCKVAAFSLKPYLQEFRKKVRFVFANYPLDNACNDNMKGPMHPYACYAAKAVLCANAKGKFWELHDDLFRNQQKLNEEKILDLATAVGMSKEETQACVASADIDKTVREQIASGQAIYVNGTPTVFVNGRKIKYWSDPAFLQAVVREEIRRTDKGLPLEGPTMAPAPEKKAEAPAEEPKAKE